MNKTTSNIVQISSIKRRKPSKISGIWKTKWRVIKWYENAFWNEGLLNLEQRENWISSLMSLMGEENMLWLKFPELPESFFEVALYISNFLYDVTFDLPKWTRIKDLPFEKLNLEGKIQKLILNELNFPDNDEWNHKKLIKYIFEWIDEKWEDSNFPYFMIENIDIVIQSVWTVLNKNLMFIDIYNVN
ncbi:MAG: hypothetical protein ACD_49C00074G0022 [uncultured bacterium (gcode 4)]|uniref:Uncharacterized protein n=1 Tax=uncultured bacterium (gcode 4) TaxID=1234023 RepID=K2AD31_9BACT|nr:MAG: hypothetical protein ACD_49C00074G0022 [uncultured bacterium (gcode 4)]